MTLSWQNQTFTLDIFPSTQWSKKSGYFRQQNYQHQPFLLFPLSVLHCAPAYWWEVSHLQQSPSVDSHPERYDYKISICTGMQSIKKKSRPIQGSFFIDTIWVKAFYQRSSMCMMQFLPVPVECPSKCWDGRLTRTIHTWPPVERWLVFCCPGNKAVHSVSGWSHTVPQQSSSFHC